MEAAPKPAIPLRRELRKPYFVYRTPDGLGSYLQREIHRALFARKDPLSRFLVAAQLTGPQVRPPAIEYDLEGRVPGDFVPMDTVAESEIAAFEHAAKEFFRKGDTPGERINLHERELRAHFRLPDPDREPDAYWLYGPPNDRRLLVLWGCEFEQNSSLPLLPGKGTTPGRSILERLQTRRMKWSAKQAQAVELLQRNQEPLAAFLAVPRRDANGRLRAVQIGGREYTADLVSVPRYIPKREIRRLASAAASFYAKARPQDTSTSAFEKELRCALRFPSPDVRRDAWVMVKTKSGRHLHVVIDGDETLGDTVPVVADPEARIPAPEKTPDGRDLVPDTAVDLLSERVAPKAKFVTLAAVAAIALGAGVIFSGILEPRRPPALLGIVAENDPNLVRLLFDSDMDGASLYSPEEIAARQSPTPPVDPPKPHIDIRDGTGRRVDIVGLALDPANPKHALVSVARPLTEDNYTLYLAGVKGRRGPPLGSLVERAFEYRDRLPPKLVAVSGDSSDARRLVLVFDEPLDDGRAGRTRNYRLQGFEFLEAQLDPRNPAIVQLSASTAFVHRERYIVAVSGVRDRSKERNEILDEITQEFVYRDTLPPHVEKVRADAEQILVEVTFSEPVQEGDAQTPGNYVISVPSEEASFQALSARLVDGERTVRLRTPALANGKDYLLKVLNIADRATPPVKIADDNQTPFSYIGTPDLEGPVIENLTVRDDGQRLTLEFNEPVTSDALEAARYRTADGYFNIAQVSADPKDATGRKYLLAPDRQLEENRKFRLVLGAITDLVGNKTPELISREVERRGIVITRTNVLGFAAIRPSPDGTTLEVTFTHEVTPATAREAANYTINDSVAVTAAAVDETARDFRRVTLVLAAPLAAKKYLLTARNLARNDNPNLVQREMSEGFGGPGYTDF